MNEEAKRTVAEVSRIGERSPWTITSNEDDSVTLTHYREALTIRIEGDSHRSAHEAAHLVARVLDGKGYLEKEKEGKQWTYRN